MKNRMIDKKNFTFQVSGYKRVKEKLRKSIKKREDKVCETGKYSYFCTRIERQVHTHTEAGRSRKTGGALK